MTIIPSLRLSLIRDGIEDFEYAEILRNLIDKARKRGIDISAEEKVLQMFKRPFLSPQSWTLSQTYWLDTRNKIANAIIKLKD